LIEYPSLRGFLLAIAATLALPASAQQILFKLVDRDGRVTYSDSVPKNYGGTVVRIESDASPSPMPAVKSGEVAPKAATGSKMAEDRRRIREDLEKKLRAAQARVEEARKAKAEGGEPLPEEMQTIQHRYAPLRSGEQPPNANCFAASDASGAPSLNCPSRVPQESFYDRQKKLDEDLKRAEEELELAERAYRRGTD
jgi:hypothetical protein